MNPIITASNLCKNFQLEQRELQILDDITLSIEANKFVVIRGVSGSGKSTLLSILSGLDTPTSGIVTIDGIEITNLSEDELAPIRNQTIGYVFQSFHLVPSLTAIENIMFPAQLAGNKDSRVLAESLLKQVDMLNRADNFPSQLSGGEKQRIAICRALINNPKVLFADEPTGNLDSKNSDIVIDALLDLQRQKQTTLVLVTHDESIAARADEVIELVDGKLA